MKKSSEFHDYVVHDVLGRIRGITSKSMFGGYGLYLDGIIFGIIAESTLYFKVNETNRAHYETLGSAPFAYSSKDQKKVAMSYWEVPEEIMTDREQIDAWVRESAEISGAKKKHR